MDKVNEFVRDALFCTITNANFDEKSIKKELQKVLNSEMILQNIVQKIT